MHFPRGSNNRLNEQSANRENANRMFDSQNNNRGGYNVGETNKENGFANDDDSFAPDLAEMWDYDNELGETSMPFEEAFVGGSVMMHTHTIQHGCGNEKNLCQLAIDMTCDTYDVNNVNNPFNQNGYQANGLRVALRNGANTGTSDDPNNIQDSQDTFGDNNNNRRGRNEAEEFYAIAKERNRNQGLFTADQNLQGNAQIYTRQNPGGTRRGLEVPEERDYDPWWYPSPWMPMYRLTNNMTDCQQRILPGLLESKCHCYPANINNGNNNDVVNQENSADCTAAGGNWECLSWQDNGRTAPTPQCVEASWSQVNNLGNVKNTEDGGLPRSLAITLPTLNQLEAAGCHKYTDVNNAEYVRAVMRIRYNMSTTDYDPLTTDANCNQDSNNGQQSPVNQNPTVDIGVNMQGLRLALNTAQTGRTFQDRSHVFMIHSPPAELTTQANQGRVLNLNVQGKRGNIVQTFPAVEYDFWPKTAEVNVGDCLAFAWTGSNTHNNGSPGGDGQTGDAGEGRGGSDRHNLMQMIDESKSYPFPMDNPGNLDYTDFFATTDCYQTFGGGQMTSGNVNSGISAKNAQAYLMSGGYYHNFDDILAKGEDDVLDPLLNNTPASMRSLTCCTTQAGEWVFTNTRNNNFSNRDQKLRIKVT